MIRVLLVEDHPIVLDGVKSLLTYEDNIKVVGEAGDGYAALRILETQQVDVAIVDIEMPNMNGIELTRQIKKQYPDTSVLILSMYKNKQYINTAIEIGADGYLLKDEANQKELVWAIKEIAKGEIYFGAEVTKIQIQSRRGKPETEQPKLTKREVDVLKLIAEDLKTHEIADRLFVAPSTIETHRRHLIKKMGVKSSLGLVRKAIEGGYLEK